jgi:hypothetical protein
MIWMSTTLYSNAIVAYRRQDWDSSAWSRGLCDMTAIRSGQVKVHTVVSSGTVEVNH